MGRILNKTLGLGKKDFVGRRSNFFLDDFTVEKEIGEGSKNYL
jgi:hypothetical protein